jgi:hypothetical protein
MAGKVSDNPNEFLLPDLGEGSRKPSCSNGACRSGRA